MLTYFISQKARHIGLIYSFSPIIFDSEVVVISILSDKDS